jgi:hypothetical protein
MDQFSMTSALFLHTVGRIAVALTFVVALVSAPVFAQGGSSKSKTKAGEPSSPLRNLSSRTNWPESCSASKGGSPLIFHVGDRVLYLQAHVPHFGVHKPCL